MTLPSWKVGAVAGFAVGVADVVLSGRQDATLGDLVFGTVTVTITIATGLVVWASRPASRMGMLITVWGICGFLADTVGLLPDSRLLVRFDSTLQSAERMAASAASLLATRNADIVILDEEAAAATWADHQSRESAGDGLVGMVSVLPTATAAACDMIERLAADSGVGWALTGRAALGVLRVHATGDAAGLRRFAAALRAAVTAQTGHVQFVVGAGVLGQAIDPRGPVGSAAAVGLAVKQRFDPAGVLPYSWAQS